MALETSKVVLPSSVATYIKDNAKDTSTIAALSPSTPQLFTNADNLIFDGASEAEVVEEGAVKSSYEQPVGSLVGKRFKVQTTTRVTNELQWADEDNQLQIVKAIQDDQVKALGRALDYVVYHAVNPKPGTVMEGYRKLVDDAVQISATDDPVADIDAITEVLNRCKAQPDGAPWAVIAETVKGKGVSFMENQAGWHGKAPNAEQCAVALAELGDE